jgi:outer membrane protein assembly factor BamB
MTYDVLASAARARRGLRACFVVILVAVASCSSGSSKTGQSPPRGSGGEWSSFILDSQNSRFQSQSTVTSDNLPDLKQKWMIPTHWSVTSTPVVLGGNVYFADWGGNVFSAQVKSGKINWKINLDNPISSTLTVAGDNIYVSLSPQDTRLVPPNNGNRVVALSRSTGAVLWQTKIPSSAQGMWSSPTLFDGMIYVGVAGGIGQKETDKPFVEGNVFALNATTGAITWTRRLNGTAGGAGLWGSVVGSTELNAVYFATANAYGETGTTGDAYSIVSLNAKTGKENWRYQAYRNVAEGDDNDFGATPNLFKIQQQGGLRAVVGVGSKDGYYYVVDAATGKLIQKTQMQQNGGVIGNAAVLRGDSGNPRVFVPGYSNSVDVASPKNAFGSVAALDALTGKVDWSTTVEGNVIGSVALVPGALLFGDARGNLYALSTKAGGTLFHKRLPNAIEAGVTPAEGHVFVATSQGNPGGPDESMSAANNGIYAFAP